MVAFNIKAKFKLVTGEGDDNEERVNEFLYTHSQFNVENRMLAVLMAMRTLEFSLSYHLWKETKIVLEASIDEKKKKNVSSSASSSSEEEKESDRSIQLLEYAPVALQLASVINNIIKYTFSAPAPAMSSIPAAPAMSSTPSLGFKECMLIGSSMAPPIQRFLDNREDVLNEWIAALMVVCPNIFAETGEGSSCLTSGDTRIFEAALQAAAKSLIEIKREVDNYDRLVGDGDCGTTLAKGALEVIKDLLAQKYPLDDISGTFKSVATTMERSIGDTAIGVIYRVGCLAVCARLKGLQTISLNEWSVALSAAISAISLCGGASEGQRTLLDALYPALASLQESIASNKDNSEAFVASAEASLEGATKTKAMIAQAGRSFKASLALQEVVPDPGAFATATWYKAAAEEYRKMKAWGSSQEC